ncbi:hydroxysteroid 11-beta dehydrogenase 1 [Salpingoeca rosetta]|uniref:Hydroxysteroid 11-beta dehydrogenase 1 n=1 Tax=Salpingoeca rosetta (strain ATCC 50818 / BSB-021) TaxID=946362 RepID=F2U134_SALR5|nr:hydroxysteroid 11-beta dehydrogenase 1 [Salpingoeca rosetta]EGD80608.1 hydroxysteroid 11-beta dehydrogenase 1 [Salpingoeca rosetta]|eukprot:XP_004997169.1 hydroxysteroid 11-beta dehydrogenase 1 [Salpingoeca rosetta]
MLLQLNHIKPYFQLFEDTDLKTLREVVDVDLYSYITITKLLLQELIARDATLVAVSSAAGKIGVPYAAVYSASKHALHGFFDSLRLEVYMTHPSSKMSITTCVIGNIDTESAKRVTAGKVRHPTRASPDDTALAIVTGALRKQREVYFPRLEVTPIPYLRAFFPSLTDYLIVNSMEAPPNRDSSLPSGAGAN